MYEDTFLAYEAKCRRLAALREQILPHNKAVLFGAFATAGVAVATIDFDGCGDSGQFETLLLYSADNEPRDIPAGPITIQTIDPETEAVVETVTTTADYMLSLASDLLEQKHGGWEDGDGAYGEFRFTLADHALTLEYNERYTATNYYEYEF